LNVMDVNVEDDIFFYFPLQNIITLVFCKLTCNFQ
jgi:hypothetical protein